MSVASQPYLGMYIRPFFGASSVFDHPWVGSKSVLVGWDFPKARLGRILGNRAQSPILTAPSPTVCGLYPSEWAQRPPTPSYQRALWPTNCFPRGVRAWRPNEGKEGGRLEKPACLRSGSGLKSQSKITGTFVAPGMGGGFQKMGLTPPPPPEAILFLPGLPVPTSSNPFLSV